MSELKVDTVKTQNENNLVVTEKLSVKDFSRTQSLFTASRENGIKLFGPVYFGNSQHDNSCGKPGEILFGNGATNSPEWRPVPVPPIINIPGNTMVQILIDYNGFCSTDTRSRPVIPTVDQVQDWYYCDGTNGTPDTRITNPLTQEKDFPVFDADLRGNYMDADWENICQYTKSIAYIMRI